MRLIGSAFRLQLAEAHRLSKFMVAKALEMEGTCTGEHGVGVGKIKYLKGMLLLVRPARYLPGFCGPHRSG